MQETLTLQDGSIVQVADFEAGFTLDSKALVEQQDDGTVIIEGYASDFDIDRQDEAFEPGAFDEGLKAFMASNPVILYHHKRDQPMGQITEARLDTKGLWVRGELDAPEPNTPAADIIRKVKSRTIRGFSVGGKFFRRMTDAGLRIFKTDLREISITPQPVNQRMLFELAGKAFDGMDDVDKPIETSNEIDWDALGARLDEVEAVFDAHEGKAGQHPDGPKIAALLYHLQKVHTLATDTKQDAQSEDTKNRAAAIADHVKTHVAALHRLAAKHGPLPDTYGHTYL